MIIYFVIISIIVLACWIIYFRIRPKPLIQLTDIRCKGVIPLLELAKKDVHAQQMMSDFITKIERGEISIPESDEGIFSSWSTVLACKDFFITRLTYEASARFEESMNNCPTCDHELIWIYIVDISKYYHLEGYLSICPDCVRQINYIDSGLRVNKRPLFH